MPLPFYIPAITGEKTTRTLVAHTARGIAWTIASSRTYAHNLDLAYALGLSTHIRWYAEKPLAVQLPDYAARTILREASSEYTRSLHDFPAAELDLALRRLKTASQVDLVLSLLTPLLNYTLLRTEKLEIMNTILPNQLPQDVFNKLEMSLASLQDSLIAQDIRMPEHLRSIHSLLITYPESVTLLDDSEVAAIIDGAEFMTKTNIVKQAASKSGGSKKKVSADDL